MGKLYLSSLLRFRRKGFRCLLTCLLASGAAAAFAQPAKVTINLTHAELPALFSEIESKTTYKFFYRVRQVENFGPVTVDARDEAVSSVLNRVFSGTRFTYSFVDPQIVIQERTTPQRAAVSGRVTDTHGNPLPGVGVAVKGTTTGIATDAGGRYTLPVSANDILLFSFVGMLPREVRYTGQTEINVTLEEDITEVEEVVVTGIFNKPRESYTGVVTTISEKELSVYRGQNLVQTLKNIDPAINILMDNNAGSNPNALPQMDIRGNSSLPMNVQEFNEGVRQTVNTPLIIMDGFEISLTRLMDYNDDEIQSINILKDAAATAIYGSRGANGVIVVVSKSPAPGRLRVSFQAGLNFEIADISTYDLLDAAEKLQLETLTGLYQLSSTSDPKRQLNLQEAYNMRLKNVMEGVDTDWISKPIRTGVGQKYNLRLEGGSDEFRWGTTVAYNNTEGAMKGSVRNTFNGAVTLSYNYKNLIFKNQTHIGLNKGKESHYGSFSKFATANPYERIYDEYGEFIPYFWTFDLDKHNVSNPVYDASLNSIDETKYTEIINNFSIEWHVFPTLRLRGQFGVSKRNNTYDRFLPAEHSYFIQTDEYQGVEGDFRKGLYNYHTGDEHNYDGNLTLSYSETFNEVHQLYAGLDYSIAQNDMYLYMIEVEGFTNEDLAFPGTALQYKKDGKPTGTEDKSRRVGLTGNVNYTYDNRYYVDGSIRMDGSSQFGSKNKFAPFWSLGAGWNVHNESFMNDNRFFNTLRMRASYGETGSQQFSAYQALATYQYFIDRKYGVWNGAELMGFGNEKLKWQVTKQWNLGVEFSILENRIRGSFDYYDKKTTNLLSAMDTQLATGFSSYVDNVGEVKNAGFETSVTGYLIRNTARDLTWLVSGKLVYNKNKITKLSDAVKTQNEMLKQSDKENVDISHLFYEGNPQNSLYAVRSLGIDPSSGRELFLDKNGEMTDKWMPSDKVYLGSAVPLYRGNASTMVMYENFTLNLSFGYHWGGYLYNQTLSDKVEVSTTTISQQNVDSRVLKQRWFQDGDLTFFKGFSDQPNRATSRFVMKDRVLEFQSASLQYRFDSQMLRRNNIQSVTLSVSMSDIFYWSSVKYERGLDYPFARRVGVTLGVIF